MVTGYFGLPGCGKSTILTKIAQKELRRIKKGRSCYDIVFTNYYCEGCYKLNFEDLGRYETLNALILLDEITLDADNRNFKSFGQEKKEFFLLHRHYNCDIVYFTQQWDGVDKKIRAITSNMYFVNKAFANLSNVKIFKALSQVSVAKRIFRTLEINEYTKDIVYGYRFPTFWEYLLGKHMVQLTFRPRWYKFFDSFDKPFELESYPLVPWSPVEVDDVANSIEDDISDD
jgi:hypothetical protein